MRLATVAALFLLLVASGCATAEGAYRAGMDFEREGDFEQASYAYYKALKRDPSLDNVRGRLEVAGREAVRGLLTRAGTMPNAPDAADAYLAADRLIRTVREVDVELDRPPTFIRDMAGHLAAAIRELLTDATRLADQAQYAQAMQKVDRATGYFPDDDDKLRIAETALSTRLAWSQAEFDQGRYRSALSQLDAALPLIVEGSGPWDDVQDRRADVLDAGTLVIALFPAELERSGPSIPDDLLRDVDDIVADRFYQEPPPFLSFVNPTEIRRVLRNGRNTDGRMDDPRLAGSLTRDVNADFGVALEVGAFREVEREVRRRAQTAPLSPGPGRATYQRVTREIEISADAAFRVVDDSGRRLECSSDDMPRRATQRYDVGEYDGDWRTLELSRSERDLFNTRDRDDARERAIRELRDSLARTMSDAVVSCLGRQIL